MRLRHPRRLRLIASGKSLSRRIVDGGYVRMSEWDTFLRYVGWNCGRFGRLDLFQGREREDALVSTRHFSEVAKLVRWYGPGLAPYTRITLY
jgi:hypothetical protein